MSFSAKSDESAEVAAGLEESLRKLRFRLGSAIFADAWLTSSTVAFFTGGAVLLVCHALGVSSVSLESIVFAALFLAPLVHCALAVRVKTPGRRGLTAVLAKTNGVFESGLIASYGEVDVKDWMNAGFQPETPRVGVDCRRRFVVLALGVVFLFGALAAPKMLPESMTGHGLNITSDSESLRERN